MNCYGIINVCLAFRLYRTFSEISEPEELEQKCSELCECLAKDLTKHNLKVC